MHYLLHDPQQIADMSKGEYDLLLSLKNLQPYGLQCKSVWYCSKECQKKDWYANRSVFSSESSPLFKPHHKTRCTLSEHPKGVQELVGALASNVTLITMLQVCAALDQES